MWQVTAAANGIVLVAYSLIAAAILVPLVRTRQLRGNLLGTATAMIFFTCAVHHGGHTLHLLLGEDPAATGWPTAVWDGLSATVAVCYWTMRGRYGALLQHGPALFADLKAGQRSALEINDTIVQGLVLARYRYENGDPELAHEAVVRTLAAARRMMSELVVPVNGVPLAPGDLVRTVPAQAGSPEDRIPVEAP